MSKIEACAAPQWLKKIDAKDLFCNLAMVYLDAGVPLYVVNLLVIANELDLCAVAKMPKGLCRDLAQLFKEVLDTHGAKKK